MYLACIVSSCGRLLTRHNPSMALVRHRVKTRSGGIMPEPQITPFGIVRVLATVIPGLLIGATISKNIANFLEENDLFVPSDDDDDDD